MTGQEYWEDVANTVKNMWVDYELCSLDDAYDAMSELADSHCTYTSTCTDTMRHTDNEDAFEEFGFGECSTWSEVVCRAAYFAYRQDLIDEAYKWTEEKIFELRKVFRCEDCDDVTPLVEAQEDPGGDEDIQRCVSCHMDYVESMAENEEDYEDEEGEE